MTESQKPPETKMDSKAIDAVQNNIDKLDGKADKFHYNQYLTSLVFRDTDALQKKIETLKDPEKKKQAYEALHSALLLIVDEHASRAEVVRLPNSHRPTSEVPIYRESLSALNQRLDDIAEMIAGGCNFNLTEAEKKEFEKWDKLPLELVKNGMAYIRAHALAQLEKNLAGKGRVNEHYLEFLIYPKDVKYIKAIIESLVYYREDTKCVYFYDAHPFAVIAWATHIGLPENFQFELRNLTQKGPKQKYTLKELIDQESTHLLTNVPLKNGHAHMDDEFFLDFLNTRNIHDINAKVGKNLQGKDVFLKDVLKSVKDETDFEDDFKREFDGDFQGKVAGQTVPQVRDMKFNVNTCQGVHAIDALLQSKAIAEPKKYDYAQKIFEKTLQHYMNISSNAPLVYRIESVGHAIELYAKNKEHFSHPNRKILQHMIDEIPEILQEIQQPGNKEMKGISWQLAHFYSALELLKGK